MSLRFALEVKVVCFSNYKRKIKDDLAVIAEKLGLTVHNNFTEAVHVMISDTRITEKSRAAEIMKVPIVSSNWLTESAKRGELLELPKFILACLAGVVVCVSGAVGDRSTIQSQCKKYGGEFSNTLHSSCTHLLLKTIGGDKYEYALKRKITVVEPEWLYNSIKNKSIEPENKYSPPGAPNQSNAIMPTQEEPSTQQPTQHQQPSQFIKQSQATTFMSQEVPGCDQDDQDEDEPDAELRIFDGYRMELQGFSAERVGMAKYKVRMGGGITIVDRGIPTYKPNIIVVDQYTDAVRDHVKRRNMVAVTFDWIVDCLDKEDELCKDGYTLYKPVTESVDKKSTKPTPKPQAPKGQVKKIEQPTSNHNDSKKHEPTTTTTTTVEKPPKQPSASSAPPITPKLLTNKRFCIHQEVNTTDRNEAMQILVEHGGIEEKDVTRADYVVWPKVVVGKNHQNVQAQPVTTAWLVECAKKNQIVSTAHDDLVFAPVFTKKVDHRSLGIVLKDPSKPLVSCKCKAIAKAKLHFMVEASGAVFADTLSKKVDYLVTDDRNSEKYEFAIKHNIPIVRTQWLLDNYRGGHLVDPSKYLLNQPPPVLDVVSDSPEILSAPIPSQDGNTQTMLSLCSFGDDVFEPLQHETPPPKKPSSAPPPASTQHANLIQRRPHPPHHDDQFGFCDIVKKLIDNTSQHSMHSDTSSMLSFDETPSTSRLTRRDLESGSFYATQQSPSNHHSRLLIDETSAIPMPDHNDIAFNRNVMNSRMMAPVSHVGNNNQQVEMTVNFETQQVVRYDMNRDKNELIKRIKDSSFDDRDRTNQSLPKREYVFTTSGFSNHEDKSEWTIKSLKRDVNKLKSVVEEELLVDRTTHLVIAKPTKTSKYLAAMAARIWIVHPSFVTDSLTANKWQDEMDYVWTPDFCGRTLGEEAAKKTDSLCRPLLQISNDLDRYYAGHGDKPKKAFHDWTVLVYQVPPDVDTRNVDKSSSLFQRLKHYESINDVVHAGGAHVIRIHDFDDWRDHDFTHVIVSKVSLSDEDRRKLQPCHDAGHHIWSFDMLPKYMNNEPVEPCFVNKKREASAIDVEQESEIKTPIRKRTRTKK
ncbi:DNA topoisomerase 2-binding protein [Acrasis kona]|uniref:DNA topoisomerase 2-binding protein n=1 Tax=Acrasis kona TaxID=1008807 RepID=A0AAW2ZR47_9EUKA